MQKLHKWLEDAAWKIAGPFFRWVFAPFREQALGMFASHVADPTYQAKVYQDQGGDQMTDKSGGNINVETGGTIKFNGVDTTPQLAVAVGGVATGYKVARGQLTTASAADTVVTGLATVVAVVASLEDDPTDDPFMVSAQIGNQAGAPAAGSVIIKTWKNTGGTDPTPLAATTFSKKVNWIAIGT
jgi:hypothetical protein